MEPWRVGEEPRGHDAADVSHDKCDGNRSRAAIMRLYVVRNPRGEAGTAGVTTYDLKK